MANEIKRIEKEFILRNISESRTPLEVHVGSERLQGYLDRFSEERLWIQLAEDIFPQNVEEITVFFRFRNNPMTFTARVAENTEEVAELIQPEELFRDLSRQKVHDDVAAWMLKPRKPLPSGADKAAGVRLRKDHGK